MLQLEGSVPPIRNPWLAELAIRIRRWQRLFQRPVHEIGHRYEIAALSRYQDCLLREWRLGSRAIERLRRLPPGFISIFSLHRETVAWLYHATRLSRPRRPMETGCGISSVITAMALQETFASPSEARLVSLEAEPRWLEATERALESMELGPWVDLRLAPLTEIKWRGRPWISYDPDVVSDVSDVDQLLIDGPPKKYGRAPVLGLLHEHLSPGARVLLDDSRRPGERAAVAMWEALGLARLVGQVPAGNGLAVLDALPIRQTTEAGGS